MDQSDLEKMKMQNVGDLWSQYEATHVKTGHATTNRSPMKS